MKIKHLISTTLLFTSVICSSCILSASAQNAVLRGNNSNSRINLRSAPTTNSKKLGYGLVGDSITILESSRDNYGYTWYKVQFPRSKAIGWIRSDFVTPFTIEGRQNEVIKKARVNLNQQVQSLKNSSFSHKLKDSRNSAQIQDRDDFVKTWQKVDPQTAPFLGSWNGYEAFWTVYPSNKKGHVCVISNSQGFIDLYFGKIKNNELHFNNQKMVNNYDYNSNVNKKYISFREGNYLEIGYIQNNQFMPADNLPLNSPRKPQEPTNFHDMNMNKLYSSSPIVKSFKNAGCTASLPKNKSASKTNIENIASGVYLSGEVPHPNGFGKKYVAFRKVGKIITGYFYVTNTDDAFCFQGMVKNNRVIEATSVSTVLNPPNSYDRITRNTSVDLTGLYLMGSVSDRDRDSITNCFTKISKTR